MVIEIVELLWDEHNIAHIARHKVTTSEVDDVVFGESTVFATSDRYRAGRVVAYGRTRAGRSLIVFLDRPVAGGRSYVVTARTMKPREERDFRAVLGEETEGTDGALGT